MTDKETTINNAKTLWDRIKTLATLKYEYAKLTFAERLTMILAAVLIGFAAFLLGIFAVCCFSIAIANLIAESLGVVWSAVIVGCFYLILIVLLFAFRKPLVINPLSRMITKMLL